MPKYERPSNLPLQVVVAVVVACRSMLFVICISAERISGRHIAYMCACVIYMYIKQQNELLLIRSKHIFGTALLAVYADQRRSTPTNADQRERNRGRRREHTAKLGRIHAAAVSLSGSKCPTSKRKSCQPCGAPVKRWLRRR